MNKLIGVVLVCLAVGAVAAPDTDPWVSNYARMKNIVPQAFEQSVQANFIDAGVVNAATVQATALSVSGVSMAPVAWSCDYDFPSIASGYCSVSNGKPCTVTGLTLGSSCTIGVAQAAPADAGSAFYAGGAILQAIARGTNLLEIEICNRLGDGGAIDIADAGYHGYCFN